MITWRMRFLVVTLPLCALAFFLSALSRSAVAQQANPASQASSSKPGPTIDLKGALERARANNQQLLSANLNTVLAREDRLQAKAGFFPSVGYGNQYIYTEGNGTPSGVFVANDGVHVYSSQGNIHVEPVSVARVIEYRRTVLAQAITEARAEILARGLTATVAQSYFALVVAQRRYTNAQLGLVEAQDFVEITQKLEKGGEVAHSDVIKARLVLQQRQRDVQDAQLAVERGRIGLAVLIFPDLDTDFNVVDDLKTPQPLAAFDEIRSQAAERSPELRAAQLSLRQETLGISAARSGYLPTFSFDYWYGINANHFATYSSERRNLGYSAQASLNFPLWNWGITKSKVRQAEFHQRQAQLDLSLTQKQLLSELTATYAEARSSLAQIGSLLDSMNLASESLRLTVLRYQAGEVSVLEVVDAQGTLIQARNSYDDGLSRYRVALANLQALTGSL